MSHKKERIFDLTQSMSGWVNISGMSEEAAARLAKLFADIRKKGSIKN